MARQVAPSQDPDSRCQANKPTKQQATSPQTSRSPGEGHFQNPPAPPRHRTLLLHRSLNPNLLSSLIPSPSRFLHFAACNSVLAIFGSQFGLVSQFWDTVWSGVAILGSSLVWYRNFGIQFEFCVCSFGNQFGPNLAYAVFGIEFRL